MRNTGHSICIYIRQNILSFIYHPLHTKLDYRIFIIKQIQKFVTIHVTYRIQIYGT